MLSLAKELPKAYLFISFIYIYKKKCFLSDINHFSEQSKFDIDGISTKWDTLKRSFVVVCVFKGRKEFMSTSETNFFVIVCEKFRIRSPK